MADEKKPTPVSQDEIDKYNREAERKKDGGFDASLKYGVHADIGEETKKNVDEKIKNITGTHALDDDIAEHKKNIAEESNRLDMNKRYQNPDAFTLPSSTFTTPEMGDYYLGAIDDTYLRKLDELLTDRSSDDAQARDAAFYTESPKHTDLGYSGGSIFVKGKLSNDPLNGNWMSGNTIRIPINSLDAGSDEATARAIKDLSSSNNPYGEVTKDDSFTMQMYGLSAPTMNRYAYETEVPLDSVQYEAKPVADVKDNSNYVYDPDSINDADNGYCNFVKVGSKWYQMDISDQTDDTITFKWLVSPHSGDPKQGLDVQQKIRDYIAKSDGNVYLQIDRSVNTEKADSQFQDIASDSDAFNTLKTWAGDSTSGKENGYCLAKQDTSARRSGVAYIKIDGKWVNLAKAALTSGLDGVEQDSDFNNPQNEDFDQNYDEDAQIFADAYFKVTDELDDRKKIQQEIFGQEWTDLHDWTVTIGDVTLLIPPTSITVVSEVEEQRVPILRAKGSMPKSGKRDTRTIGMSIYFSGDNSINGYPYKTKSPSGQEFQYSLDGLRALIAEFKFTPFLPIENKYLNETLGIQAVTFNSLSLTNVPSIGPRLIEAELTMTEFDYSVYLPENVLMCAETQYKGNWFSTSFNWPVMRYYYQRSIMAGDHMASLLTSYTDENTGENVEYQSGVNSSKYIKESLKNRTALQPMQFQSSKLKFYIADEDYLEKMLDAKKQRRQNYLLSINFDEDQKKAMGDIADSLGDVYDKLHSDDFKKALDQLNAGGNLVYNDKNYFFDRTAHGDTFKDTGLAYTDSDGNIDRNKDADKALNDALGPILAQIKECDGVLYARFMSDASLNGNDKNAQFGIEIMFKNDNLNNDETIKKLQGNIAAMTGEPDGACFKNGRLFLPLNLNLKNGGKNSYSGDGQITLDDNNPDMKFLKYCCDYKKERDGKDGGDNADADQNDANPAAAGAAANGNGVTSWKKAPNLAQLDSLKFTPFDCGNFVVTAFSAQLTNHESKMNLQDMSGSTPQYLGGEDIHFGVSVITTDKQTASAFTLIPKRIASIMRRYREIIPCCPFKVDSEFTRFLGVNEVNVTNVSVATIPKQPGVYKIDFTMISTDRTLRNREAMEMIEADNAGNRFDQKTALKDIKSYFDIENMIAQAELYPDLELPTLDEMNSLGWEFVRYKFQDARTYVDPDFYFVYLSQLSSEFLRETIINSVKEGVDGQTDCEDNSGAQLTINPQKFCGFTTNSHNAALDNQLKAIKDAKSAKYSLNAKRTAENLRNSRDKLTAEDYEGWDICNDIKAMFMEQRYKKEYDSYVARLKSQSVSSSGDSSSSEQDSDAQQAETDSQSSADSSQESSSDTQSSSESSDADASNSDSNAETSSDAGDQSSSSDTSSDNGIDTTQTEGKWVASQLENAQKASSKIKDFLANHPIDVAVPDSNTIREEFIQARDSGKDTKNCYDALKTAIQNAVSHFFAIGEVREIMELLNFDISDSFLSVAKDIVFSAACAATGEKEFSNKRKSTNWMPAPDFIGVTSGGGVQDATNATVVYDVDEAIENATEFGVFKIKQYTREEFIQATEEDPENPWNEEMPSTNTSHWLLDRYYRYQPEETIAQYKKGCINSTEFCTQAYMRNVLYWLKSLVDNQALPSINADILRKTTNKELEIEQKESELDVDDKEKNAQLQDHIKFFSKNVYAIDAGKLWTASCLASSDGNEMIRRRIHDRDYRALNEYTHGCSVPKTAISTDDKVSTMMRKMNLALIGQQRIKDSDAVGVPQDMPAVQHARDYTEKKYIEAAEDPKQYMIHSCHDMIVHDARGRMLRAFPTYYMLFIDEGREVGNWRLHDNFYNSMSIMEFTIVKDRKNPADTANIVLSNLYQACSTEQEDKLRQQEGSWGDAYDAIFNPNGRAIKAEEKRRGTNPEDKIRLRAGARIHLRAGYGSNAAMMPVVFNGVIAEVSAQDTINIVAQGDGIELMNPIMEKEEAHDVTNDWTFLKNGDTPKNIMSGLFNYDGGFMARQLKKIGRGDLLGDNPFGIYHFGSKNFKDIATNGECCQNIFEAWSKPSWGDGSSAMEITHAPVITMDVFGKTVWDIANICKSVMPDFICSVAPFNMRSTLFIGMPRYYYAYDYTNINGAIQEKRKPFQQYHVYASGTDILADGITASSRKMKTTATGLYQVCATANTKEQHTVGPLYADIDIYPEDQKSMIVDTQLLAKGVPYLGAAGLNMITSFDTVDKLITGAENVGGHVLNFFAGGDTGKGMENQKSNESIAWRMTASALKDSVKEMYCGDLVVLGDPTVKPHDRIYLMDTYEGINGQVTVKEVVHHMSIDEGFTTTVSPDCINIVDDRFEHIVHTWFNHTGGIGAANIAAGALTAFNAIMYAFDSDKLITISKVLNAMKPGKTIATVKGNKYGAKILAKGSELKGKAIEAGKKAGKTAEGVISTSAKGAKAVDKVKKGAGAIKGIGAAILRGAPAGPYGIVASVAATLAMDFLIESVGTMISSMIDDFMRNLQVLTVFPLQRYGLTWTAGLQGSKGMIFGSPSYQEQGALSSLVSSFISPDNPIGGAIAACLFDDSTRSIADSMKRKYGYTGTASLTDLYNESAANAESAAKNAVATMTKSDSDSSGSGSSSGSDESSESTSETETTTDDTPEETSGDSGESSSEESSGDNTDSEDSNDSSDTSSESDTAEESSGDAAQDANFNSFRSKLFMLAGAKNGSYNVRGDYRQMELLPRADFSRGDDVAQSYYYFQMMDPENFQNDPKLNYNVLISEDQRLRPYIDEDFFKIIHQYPNLDLGQCVESREVNLNGQKKYVKVIEYTLDDGSLVYDIPMLNPEALNILYEIIRRAKNMMPAANSSDPYESFDEVKNSFITLESALRVGDTESYAAAGYTFIVRGVENAVNPLRTAIVELSSEIAEDAKEGRAYNDSLFDVQDLGEDKIAVVVRMPRITNQNAEKDPVNVQDTPVPDDADVSDSGDETSEESSDDSAATADTDTSEEENQTSSDDSGNDDSGEDSNDSSDGTPRPSAIPQTDDDGTVIITV